MAAKGTESKNIIFNKLQEVYPDAFWEDQGKILRIPLTENGARIEIKVSLTAAKTNMGGDEPVSAFELTPSGPKQTSNVSLEPTEEEKQNIANLLNSLGL